MEFKLKEILSVWEAEVFHVQYVQVDGLHLKGEAMESTGM